MYFGTSPEIWLDPQSDYERRVARQTTWTRVEPKVMTRTTGSYSLGIGAENMNR